MDGKETEKKGGRRRFRGGEYSFEKNVVYKVEFLCGNTGGADMKDCNFCIEKSDIVVSAW